MGIHTDTQQSYTVLLAKHYDADYQINAVSGRGLIRNLPAARSTNGLLAMYPFTFPDRTVPYADPAWKPQIIEIAGLVDLSAGDQSDDRWADADALIADWIKAFGSLAAELHRRSPRAALLIDWMAEDDINPPEFRAKFAVAKKAIEAAAHKAGVKTVLFLDGSESGSKFDMLACDHYLSVRDNALLADWFAAYIDAHPGLWKGGGSDVPINAK
jgi:hypothetical protein